MMADTKVLHDLSFLQRSQVSRIVLDPQTLALCFEFVQIEGHPDTILELHGTALIQLAKHVDDEEMLAIVGEASLSAVTDGGFSTFKILGYPFSSGKKVAEPFVYPDIPMVYFHLEGDICADIVCKDARLRSSKAVSY